MSGELPLQRFVALPLTGPLPRTGPCRVTACPRDRSSRTRYCEAHQYQLRIARRGRGPGRGALAADGITDPRWAGRSACAGFPCWSPWRCSTACSSACGRGSLPGCPCSGPWPRSWPVRGRLDRDRRWAPGPDGPRQAGHPQLTGPPGPQCARRYLSRGHEGRVGPGGFRLARAAVPLPSSLPFRPAQPYLGPRRPAEATVVIPLHTTTAAKVFGVGAATGRATARQAGESWTFDLSVHGLKPLPGNDVYVCWWAAPGSTKARPVLATGGSFVVGDSGSATLTMTTGVDPRQSRTMEITAESPGSGALQRTSPSRRPEPVVAPGAARPRRRSASAEQSANRFSHAPGSAS